MHSILPAAFVLAFAALASAAEAGLPVARHDEAPKHPWYVKYASSQIVDFCCWGGLSGMGGGFSLGGGEASPVGFSTIAFSSAFTETLDLSTATTLYTTIPGSVVTIYGSEGVQSTSVVSPTTVTSVVTPVITSVDSPTFVAPVAAATTPARGLVGFIEELEHYAHALAEAIVAPAEMTALLSSAGDDLMEHGFIHATKAEAYVSQASRALEALRTDPAYSAQSANLAAQPTHIDFKRAFSHVRQTHSAGLERFLAEPQGRSVGGQVRDLMSKFLDIFGH